jgi:hypothetical protein
MFLKFKRTLLVQTLEKLLNFLLTQIILCEKMLQHSSRDKKMFKRELNSEIVKLIIFYLNKYESLNFNQNKYC